MDTDYVRLNVTLPKHLVQMMDRMTGSRKRSMFIAEAVQQKVNQTRKEALERQMAEGYRAGCKEGLEIASEFEVVDLEGWEDYE
jgi:CopG family transcriptional regulator / antitoxin EndoAI